MQAKAGSRRLGGRHLHPRADQIIVSQAEGSACKKPLGTVFQDVQDGRGQDERKGRIEEQDVLPHAAGRSGAAEGGKDEESKGPLLVEEPRAMQEIRELLGKQPVHGGLEEMMVSPGEADFETASGDEMDAQSHERRPERRSIAFIFKYPL